MKTPAKKIDLFSALLGIAFGLFLAGALPSFQRALAEETNAVVAPPKTVAAAPKKESMSQEEMDKKLDDIIDSQKKIQEKINAAVEKSKTLKAAIR